MAVFKIGTDEFTRKLNHLCELFPRARFHAPKTAYLNEIEKGIVLLDRDKNQLIAISRETIDYEQRLYDDTFKH